jgi:hypothetical protein
MYQTFFKGQCSIPGAKELLKGKAPPLSCKFFVWLALLGRCWTSDRLQCHCLPNSSNCALCSQSVETLHHLLLSCIMAREVWFRVLRPSGHQNLASGQDKDLVNWWIDRRKRVSKSLWPGFDSLVILVWWRLWKERNARIFESSHTALQALQLLQVI